VKREFSAGGVVVREAGQGFEVAVITPRGKKVTALPKGHIDAGETPEGAAQREVLEETGVTGELVEKLGDVKYFYRFGGTPVRKQVSFFLFRAVRGEIDALDPKMRQEVEVARWLPLAEAPVELSYPGERDMARKALEVLSGRGKTHSS
jgi:8-oxo-dGTP pyrophosphatase MutT (NUDIX family)